MRGRQSIFLQSFLLLIILCCSVVYAEEAGEAVEREEFEQSVLEIKEALALLQEDLTSIRKEIEAINTDTVQTQYSLVQARNDLEQLLLVQPQLEQPGVFTSTSPSILIPIGLLIGVNLFFLLYIIYDYFKYRRKQTELAYAKVFEEHIDRLGEYIGSHLGKGFSLPFIRQMLLNHGWEDHHIEYAYKKHKGRAGY